MDNAYLEIVNNPIQMRKLIVDFDEWLDLGSKDDLIATLKVYENSEMYEDCILIKNKIDSFK